MELAIRCPGNGPIIYKGSDMERINSFLRVNPCHVLVVRNRGRWEPLKRS